MKNILRTLIVISILILFVNSNAGATNFGFYLGLSTPSDQINNVYNTSSIKDSSGSLWNLAREGSKFGYHLGVKVRVGMSDNWFFVGGIAYHKFPQTSIQVINPKPPYDTLTTLQTSQNVVPITAGVNFFLLKQFIGLYGVGELTYNYVSSSVDYYQGSVPISLSKSPTDNRIGFGIGAGADLNVQLVTLNLEIKYNYINLIGQKAGEDSKAYLSVSLGVIF